MNISPIYKTHGYPIPHNYARNISWRVEKIDEHQYVAFVMNRSYGTYASEKKAVARCKEVSAAIVDSYTQRGIRARAIRSERVGS